MTAYRYNRIVTCNALQDCYQVMRTDRSPGPHPWFPRIRGYRPMGSKGRLLADAHLTSRRRGVSSCRSRLGPTRKDGWIHARERTRAGSRTGRNGGTLGEAVPHALHLPHRHLDEAGFITGDGFPDRSGEGGG